MYIFPKQSLRLRGSYFASIPQTALVCRSSGGLVPVPEISQTRRRGRHRRATASQFTDSRCRLFEQAHAEMSPRCPWPRGCLLEASWVFPGSQGTSRWLKIEKYHNIHKIHAPKMQGRVFSGRRKLRHRRTELGDPWT